jgi:hypothetical protein
MHSPGYYKTNYRALRFRELVRMHGMPKGFKAYLVSRFMRPAGCAWMPSLWADIECKAEDLSPDFVTATKPHRRDFERLGFMECGFSRVRKSLDPRIRDSGGVRYLDPTRTQFGQLIYQRYRLKSKKGDTTNIVIAFTACLAHGNLSCANNKNSFDAPDGNTVIRVASYDVAVIYQQFLHHLHQRKETPRSFPDLESLRQWFDERQIKAFEERAARRLFLPMTQQEVAAAQASLRGEKGPPPLPASRPRPNFKWGVWLLIILAICALQFVKNRSRETNLRQRSRATIEYRGQEFKLRKAYPSYEDYKDDPNNLDTNELDRIEQAIVSAPVPSSFKDREALIHFVFSDLRFPGYGLSLLGEQKQTDDGSQLYVESIEIPQRDKELVIAHRSSGGELKLVDDFVYSTSTNAIARIKLEKRRLYYYDRNNNVVREKTIENP